MIHRIVFIVFPLFAVVAAGFFYARWTKPDMAAANRMLGRHEDALRQYLPAIMADPLDPAPLYYSAESLVEMGRGEEAIEALDTVEALCEGQDKYAALAARARILRGALAGPQA